MFCLPYLTGIARSQSCAKSKFLSFVVLHHVSAQSVNFKLFFEKSFDLERIRESLGSGGNKSSFKSGSVGFLQKYDNFLAPAPP